MALTMRHKNQLDRQIKEHVRHRRPYALNPPVSVAPGVVLADLVMFPDVLQPMSSRHLASYLFRHPELYANKTVIDIGCGCGVLGLVCAIQGAKRVVFSDVSREACRNTAKNIRLYGVSRQCQVVQGDLFERASQQADLIIFAQPYFPAPPIPGMPVTRGMLDEGTLIHRFFEQAKSRMRGSILMPYLEWIGPTNNPRIQAGKHGLRAKCVFKKRVVGLQRGSFSIYQLSAPA